MVDILNGLTFKSVSFLYRKGKLSGLELFSSKEIRACLSSMVSITIAVKKSEQGKYIKTTVLKTYQKNKVQSCL